jgi:hypothetical protein
VRSLVGGLRMIERLLGDVVGNEVVSGLVRSLGPHWCLKDITISWKAHRWAWVIRVWLCVQTARHYRRFARCQNLDG